MIIIAGTVDFHPHESQAALEAGREIAAATRTLEGCLDYVWSADPVVPGRVYVFERWADEDALRAHFEGALYRDMREVLRRYEKLRVDVSKYRIDLREPVYDRDGNPRADFSGESERS